MRGGVALIRWPCRKRRARGVVGSGLRDMTLSANERRVMLCLVMVASRRQCREGIAGNQLIVATPAASRGMARRRRRGKLGDIERRVGGDNDVFGSRNQSEARAIEAKCGGGRPSINARSRRGLRRLK